MVLLPIGALNLTSTKPRQSSVGAHLARTSRNSIRVALSVTDTVTSPSAQVVRISTYPGASSVSASGPVEERSPHPTIANCPRQIASERATPPRPGRGNGNTSCLVEEIDSGGHVANPPVVVEIVDDGAAPVDGRVVSGVLMRDGEIRIGDARDERFETESCRSRVGSVK